ncbi:YdeI/OmpD-associated family protein [Enterococcus sp. DIV0242_7C1]|uniref:Laac n=1 Tax=Candidatus Enterococcus dunnyi TaxID=1834192 RepID=A0A200JAA3_9ENTE|nr:MULTISPECIES: YdeI/OmpD-associated family protein [unclassified Enterococcus]MBO0471930.1 YdeI/OmpD-associated family protein [Enterococcus sp. DIV0242_7C1]OUZ33527.1 hypothetical protein A5889_002242 [Enterococcus sp. 9D6_DIV0238]
MAKSVTEKLKLMVYPIKAIVDRPNESYLSELKDAQLGFPTKPVDLLFVFVKTMDEFKKIVHVTIEKELLNKDGVLFVAYPKKGNKMYPTFVHRDEIFPALDVDDSDGYVGKSTLKFNRMVSLDEVFTVTGLKNTERKAPNKKATSARVEDYVKFIPQVEKLLEKHSKAKVLFDNLTPGYKRDWARYIFSAKQQTTQDKRKAEMIDILEKGFKSKELYRQSLSK